MKSLLDIVNESDLKMPRYITVRKPNDWKSTVRIETIPEVAWAHMYPFSYHDELNWQRRIPGESKHGKTLTHEEGNYIYFLLEQPSGKSWDLVGIYNMKEETLYFDTLIRNFESWMGANFSVSMREFRPELPY
jgi:hypothetical protein